jgi:acetyltransferase-like isoleucine patch superfamily enzyme
MAPPPDSLRGRPVRERTRASFGALRVLLRVPADRRVPPPRAFARFGDGSWIVPPGRVAGTGAIEVGAGVIVLEDSDLLVDAAAGARLVIGDRTRLAPGARIVCTVGVTIGTAVSSSDGITITDSWGPVGDRPHLPGPPGAPIVIEDGAYLGWGSVIGPGVRIGAGAIVGEGAVVDDDVAPHTVVYGNPARLAPGYGDVARPGHLEQLG